MITYQEMEILTISIYLLVFSITNFKIKTTSIYVILKISNIIY